MNEKNGNESEFGETPDTEPREMSGSTHKATSETVSREIPETGLVEKSEPESQKPKAEFPEAPEAIVETRRQISIVWLVPVVALVIGGWLVYKAITEKGPVITITFKTAEGLEAGKTKIKYKDVEVGKVETIDVSEDLTHVIVTAKLVKGAKRYLTEHTRFWVVRARVAAGEVSGLGTLFSGAYIGVDPGKSGAPKRDFKGLEIPPVVTADRPGRHFAMRANRLGSLDIGSPVYYRQIKVGQIVGYKLGEDKRTIHFRVFINAPHHELVRENTKFWNSAGVDMDISAEGVQVRTESLVSLLLGGIAFDVPPNLAPGDPAREDQVFTLYARHKDILEISTADMRRWILQFEGSVRGLSVGAPVEFRGIRFGEVTHIMAEYDMETLSPRIRVFIATEPQVFEVVNGEIGLSEMDELEKLVGKGMRAQLKTGSLLTGQLFVDFDFYPDAPPAEIEYDGVYPKLPTVPAPLEMITAGVYQLLNKLEKLPIEEIGDSIKGTVRGAERLLNSVELEQAIGGLNQTMSGAEQLVNSAELKQVIANLNQTIRGAEQLVNSAELKQAIANLNQTLDNTNQITGNLKKTVAPELNSAISKLNDTLAQTEKTLADIGSVVNSDSALYRELNRTMKELADAANSVSSLADYLERHPDALIYGKGTGK